MKVSIIGTGYVGLVSGTCFAELGHDVICIDINQEKIDLLNSGGCPIYEPGLEELIKRNVGDGRLKFTTSYDSIKESRSTFIAVGTPSKEDGEADLRYVKDALISISKYLPPNGIIVLKSTVPIGTHKWSSDILQEHCQHPFHVVNNPEFLKEGSAVQDFMKPDRVVIGFSDPEAGLVMEELYEPLLLQGNPLVKMDNISAEMTKYAANSFLATKISFINEMAQLCDQFGADIKSVREGITTDKRIGNSFLYPGIGYGGSCFPKDVKALIYSGKQKNYNCKLVEATEEVNQTQKMYLVNKITEHLGEDLKDKTFALWGVAFKPNTDDIREAPALTLVTEISKRGGKVKFYDPVASKNFSEDMKSVGDSLIACEDKYDCLKDADALILATEWPEFRSPDFDRIKTSLSTPLIFDGRNQYRMTPLVKMGFTYFGVGRRSL